MHPGHVWTKNSGFIVISSAQCTNTRLLNCREYLYFSCMILHLLEKLIFVALLNMCGIELNCRESFYFSCILLHLLERATHIFVALLNKCGIDLNCRESFYFSCIILHLLERATHIFVALLNMCGIDLNCRESFYFSCMILHLLERATHIFVALLNEFGIDLNSRESFYFSCTGELGYDGPLHTTNFCIDGRYVWSQSDAYQVFVICIWQILHMTYPFSWSHWVCHIQVHLYNIAFLRKSNSYFCCITKKCGIDL